MCFYDGDEIVAAKDLLFKCSGDLNLDGAPRCVNRRKDDKKSKLDTDDLLGLVAFIDEQGALDSMPKFVAANLERVPPMQSDVLDLCLAVNRIAVLESKMEQLMLHYVQSSAPQQVSSGSREVQLVTPPAPSASGASGRSEVSEVAAVPLTPTVEVRSDGASSTTWSTLARDAAQSEGEWQTVSRASQKKMQKPAVRVRGIKAAAEGSVTAVPRQPPTPQQPVLSAFVGRLRLGTTEEHLTEYLKTEGMQGVVCRKLKPKEHQTFRTAAFYVSC